MADPAIHDPSNLRKHADRFKLTPRRTVVTSKTTLRKRTTFSANEHIASLKQHVANINKSTSKPVNPYLSSLLNQATTAIINAGEAPAIPAPAVPPPACPLPHSAMDVIWDEASGFHAIQEPPQIQPQKEPPHAPTSVPAPVVIEAPASREAPIEQVQPPKDSSTMSDPNIAQVSAAETSGGKKKCTRPSRLSAADRRRREWRKNNLPLRPPSPLLSPLPPSLPPGRPWPFDLNAKPSNEAAFSTSVVSTTRPFQRAGREPVARLIYTQTYDVFGDGTGTATSAFGGAQWDEKSNVQVNVGLLKFSSRDGTCAVNFA